MTGWSTEFETGLLDDFDLTITRSWFATDQKYNNGETTLLQWEGKTDSIDVPETHIWFPLGKGWSSKDGGKTIVHDSGKEGKYFVNTSLIAKLIKRCVDEFGLGEVLASRGGPFESAPWQGLTFHLKSEVMDFGGGGFEAKPKVFPNRFVGVAANGSGPAPGQVAAAPAAVTGAAALLAAAAAKKAAASNGAPSLEDQIIAAMKPHKANGDFASAQAAAIQLEGVATDEELVNQLLDESGFYAKA